jgi:hypothetical protein
MRWDQIARAWMQLVAKMASPRNSAPEGGSRQGDTIRTASFTGDFYEETRMTPCTRDNHMERADWSQHLSC